MPFTSVKLAESFKSPAGKALVLIKAQNLFFGSGVNAVSAALKLRLETLFGSLGCTLRNTVPAKLEFSSGALMIKPGPLLDGGGDGGADATRKAKTRLKLEHLNLFITALFLFLGNHRTSPCQTRLQDFFCLSEISRVKGIACWD